MAKMTNRGIEFANEIAPYVRSHLDTEVETRGVLCSLIARHAKTHRNYAEAACNRSLTPAEERKVDQIETRIRALVAQLETHDGQPVGVKFTGDPRGYTVKLVIPGAPGTTWGGGGEYGI
jgi:hypothetical protein